MGGDNAPRVTVMGAVQAAKEFGYEVILVGREQVLKRELERTSFPKGKIEIVDAQEVITMNDAPSEALKKKKKSSIHVALDILRRGDAHAFVSAGNTGAVMAVSLFKLGRIKGVERPAITAILPNLKNKTFLLDVGANVDCKPSHLLQFAIMGSAFARYVLKEQNPKVGLLNVGEEEVKGNEVARIAHSLLKKARESGLNFVGNAEGRDIYSGKFDVVVCDGFVGNVVLKLSESVPKIIFKIIKEEVSKSFFAKLGALMMKPAFRGFKRRVDYAEWGGAPLLGLKKAVIIAHGSSNAKAIKNAIKAGAEFASSSALEHIEEDIERVKGWV